MASGFSSVKDLGIGVTRQAHILSPSILGFVVHVLHNQIIEQVFFFIMQVYQSEVSSSCPESKNGFFHKKQVFIARHWVLQGAIFCEFDINATFHLWHPNIWVYVLKSFVHKYIYFLISNFYIFPSVSPWQTKKKWRSDSQSQYLTPEWPGTHNKGKKGQAH